MKERTRAKVVQRATRASDVTRARTLALAALGAAVGAGAVVVSGVTPSGAERPLARPHAAAKIACAKCHEASPDAGPQGAGGTARSRIDSEPAPSFATGGACRGCHGKSKHGSTRPAHRALAARGQLSCATCHPAHAGAQGVTFGEDGSFVRWGAGAEQAGPRASVATVKAGTTVPLVALAACASCHDPTSARDPIASCTPAEVRRPSKTDAGAGATLARTPSLCFDEHRPVALAESRGVAWEGARAAATTTAWVGTARTSGSPWLPLGGAAAGALLLGASAALVERRKRSKGSAPLPQAKSPSARKRLPMINPSTCLGCYACVDVCPFEVLAVERYVAVVVRPDECCGVILCQQVCPNGSLTIAEGEPVLDLPAVDDHLESKDVPGLFLAGDLTGLPLIKNAINQGVRAIDRIATTLPKKRRESIDVIVVGAGPAGLSAALRAQEKGLSCVVVEQATLAASVKSFPRDKIVYDPPLDLPLEGELWLKEATKEELVAQWTRIVRARAVDVREGRRVTSVEREAAEVFVVTTARSDGSSETYRAARVLLAIGRRGTPREIELTIEPGAEGRISYALADARSFAGKRVVIAGLGDTAMEAAIAIARQPETSVTIVYRGASFTRGKTRNIAEVKELAAKGRLRILFESIPVAVTRAAVAVAGTAPGKGRRTLQADALLVLLGGVPSWDLLGRAGIRRSGPPQHEEAE